jgi:hypothetical protein
MMLNNRGVTDAEKTKTKIAKEMLLGISSYIPGMVKAKIVDVKFGIVQTEDILTLADLKNPESSFHKRNYHGVCEEQIGVVSNPAIKLFYFVENGELVADMIDAQHLATKQINQCIFDIERDARANRFPLSAEERKAIIGYLKRHTSSSMRQELMQKKLNKPHLKAVELNRLLAEALPKCS